MNKQEKKQNRLDKRQSNELKYKDKFPSYTRGEEIFNAVTHIVGGAFGIIALIVGIIYSVLCKPGDTTLLVSMILFGLSIIVLYTMSAIYHFLFINKGKVVFRIFDHCTIYILISGTYLPLCLSVYSKYAPYNYILLGIVLGGCLIGLIFNAIMMEKLPVKIISYTLYICCGWAVIFTYSWMIETLTTSGMLLILFGGISYTIGVIFYALGKKIKYFHSIWHLFDLLGTMLQFLGILLYWIIF